MPYRCMVGTHRMSPDPTSALQASFRQLAKGVGFVSGYEDIYTS